MLIQFGFCFALAMSKSWTLVNQSRFQMLKGLISFIDALKYEIRLMVLLFCFEFTDRCLSTEL